MALSGRRNIHPFPARMAPDVALDKVQELSRPGDIVLDPMCGSGTVPKIAAAARRLAMASDMDPLAVMMTRTVCKPSWSSDLIEAARKLVEMAERLDESLPRWVAQDSETKEFVEYWFAESQRWDVARLARLLHAMPKSADPLRMALSRIIVTKSGGASLARDTSHSRPHRVALTNDYEVFPQFLRSAEQMSNMLQQGHADQAASVRTADARKLGHIRSNTVQLVVTSPPYLNAIDYLRGHRLTLVWLGMTMSAIREIRGDSIGAESGLPKVTPSIIELATAAVPRIDDLPSRHQRMVWRFAKDMDRLCRSMYRVVRPGGHLVLVVADSMLKGVPISNSALASQAAECHGFETVDSKTRLLPQQHRYLPPPESGQTTLGSRMREEYVISFRKPKY